MRPRGPNAPKPKTPAKASSGVMSVAADLLMCPATFERGHVPAKGDIQTMIMIFNKVSVEVNS